MFGLERESQEIQEEVLPWLIFGIQEELYAVNSAYVEYITPLPETGLTKVPDMAKARYGLMPFQEGYVSLLSMRTLFGLSTLEDEYEMFKDMIEHRKQDHLDWVEELKRCTHEEEPFTLATDPHQCAFGRWYDSFVSEQPSINSHLAKIDDPHKRLHQTAGQIVQCCGTEKGLDPDCTQSILMELEQEIVPMVVGLLDETKEIFSSHYREMVIIIEEGQERIGLIVDSVRSVDQLDMVDDKLEAAQSIRHSEYISKVAKLSEADQVVFILDEHKLLRC